MKNFPIKAASAVALLGVMPSQAYQFFEGDGFGTWVEEGTGFGKGPASGDIPGVNGDFSGQSGDQFAVSGHGGDQATGSLTSPEFQISKPFLHFLVAGGNHAGKTAVQLLVGGEVALEATGNNDLKFRPVAWDISQWNGKAARLRILDNETGGWGIIAADHFVFSDEKEIKFPGPTASGMPETKLVDSGVIPGNNIPEGSSLTVYADHASHKITSPTAFAFDESGALYVTETHRFRFGVMDDRDHRYWYFDDLAAQSTDDRVALHEKWKEKLPLEKLTERTEIIRRLTDENGDAKADSMTVFADGFNNVLDGTAAGIFSYQGKTYFACIPSIHVLEDTTGNGVADKRWQVADGFGVRISLSGHDLNGFALGNDGRIYGTIGDRGFSTVTREGVKYHYPAEGAIFRFEPDGSDFEVIHTGLRNPKEIAFDEFGNGVTVDNNSDQGDPSRIVYIMDGVDSGWRMQHQALHTFREDIGLPERPISPWMTEKMANVRNDDQPAFIVPPVGELSNGPSGLTYHPGSGFLESERGRFLLCDYKASPAISNLWSFKVEMDGAGMNYKGAYKFNTGVAPTDVEYGFDGRLYVADFISGWTSHEAGRIYSLTADKEENSGLTPDTAKLIREGFDKRSNAELARLFAHADQRVRMRAHITLAGRKDGTAPLTAATRQDDLFVRLHGLWGLGIRARKHNDATAAAELVSLLKDDHPEVRAQAAQWLGEVKGIQSSSLISLLQDDSLRVRSFAAISLGRHKAREAYEPILALLEENADADLYLRHAGIMGLLGAADAGQIASLASHSSSSVRTAAVVALRRLKDARIADFLTDADPSVADEAIRGIHDERIDGARAAVAALLDAYNAENASGRKLKPMIARRLLHTAFRLGGQENAKRLISAAASEGLEQDQRTEALRLLSQWPEPHPVDQSIGIWDPLPKRSLDDVAPIFEAGLPALLAGAEFLLAPTLGLVDALKLGKESLPAESLLRIANTASLPEAARSAALELLLAGDSGNADDLLISLANDPSDSVAAEALSLLAKRNPGQALESAKTTLESPGAARRQAAWDVLATIPGDASAALIAGALQNQSDPDSLIEIVEAAEKREEPAVKAALDSHRKSLDAENPLSKWLPALNGGDARRGENLFYNHGAAQCMRCHLVGDSKGETGADAGPNLAGVGAQHDRQYLLKSLIQPSAELAPGFGIISLSLANGGSLGGILHAETEEHYDVVVGTDAWRVKKSDVQSATEPVSTMPPMEAMLTIREVRDLIAYLDSLKTPPASEKAKIEPKPYDPASAKAGN